MNAYLSRMSEDLTAKDFRTWHATVLAAVALAAPRARATPALEEARGQGSRRGGRGLPRQHPDDRAQLLHRPAGHRPLRRLVPRSTRQMVHKKYRSPAVKQRTLEAAVLELLK